MNSEDVLKMVRNDKLPADREELNLLFAGLTDNEETGNPPTVLLGGHQVFPFLPVFWPQIYHFPVIEDDVAIASFPKSGTTWLQHMAYLVATEDFDGASKIPIDERVPFLEYPRPASYSTLDGLASRPGRRLFKTHLPANLLPKDMHKGKVIYVYRNAKDVVVSFFPFIRRICERSRVRFSLTFDDFARRFMEEKVNFGPYPKHILGYHELQKRSNSSVLMLRYEDMKLDTRGQIRKIAAFLNKNLPDETVERIYEATTFDSMRENDATNYKWYQKAEPSKATPTFMRKGIIGDWRNEFADKNLLKEFDGYIKANLPDELIFKDNESAVEDGQYS